MLWLNSWSVTGETDEKLTSICLTVNTYGLLTKCEVKMTGYWSSSFFANLWIEMQSRSINTQKRSEANIQPYYTTQAVRGPITKINQSKCSIAGPIFSKYRTGHCPEWSRTYVFAFFSRVINLLLTKLARDRTWRISALCLFCTNLAALGPYYQDLGPIFSQYGPRAWLIRCIAWPASGH